MDQSRQNPEMLLQEVEEEEESKARGHLKNFLKDGLPL